MEHAGLADRLEMLLVLRWLDEGAPAGGELTLSVGELAAELEAGEERGGVLRVMGALGELEERGALEVSWPGGARAEAHVRLGEHLRHDARQLFGR